MHAIDMYLLAKTHRDMCFLLVEFALADRSVEDSILHTAAHNNDGS